MTAPLSQDLHKRPVRAVEEGASAREAAARFVVSASAAIKLARRVRQTSSTAPAKIGGYRKPLLADQEERGGLRISDRWSSSVRLREGPIRMTGKQTRYSAEFKAKVALEALRGELCDRTVGGQARHSPDAGG